MISPDLPITKAKEDILNRDVFAASLAKTILQYSFPSSFTIGIYGEWGSGKTSLLNMILENIENTDDSAVILKFNPWLCSDPKQLITQFFKQMATAVKLKKPKAEKAWELIDQYADIFDAASVIPIAGSIVTALGKILGKGARKRVERRARDLQESKNQIIKRMIEEKLKIIVSIDDIDRLSEEEIIAVFQLVKSLADFPNTTYILSFDYDVVVHALSKVQQGDGKEYLEKIVQVPFEIPAPNISNIYNALFSKLDSILGNIPDDCWEKEIWAQLFQYGLKKYIKSIRDVIRFSNVFLLKYELLKNETSPVDLLGLTSLQVIEPSVYSKLPSYKKTLCGPDCAYVPDLHSEEERIKNTILQLIPNDGSIINVEAANNILNILFPRTRISRTLNSLGRTYSHSEFLINNNIALPECFDRYFALTLEDDDISTYDVQDLIYNASESEFNERLLQYYEDGKIIRLIENITAYADVVGSRAISAERAFLITTILARNWSTFEVDDSGFFSLPFAWRFIYCINPLLKRIEPESRFIYIRSILKIMMFSHQH